MKKTQQRKLLNFQIFDEVFNRIYDVYIGDKELTKTRLTKRYGAIPEKLNDDYDGLSAIFKRTAQPDISFIYLGTTDPDLIAHEALHAIINVLEFAGIDFNRETEEVFTYYQGFLIKKIMDKVEEYKKRYSKKRK
jgi:hypothetical protein